MCHFPERMWMVLRGKINTDSCFVALWHCLAMAVTESSEGWGRRQGQQIKLSSLTDLKMGPVHVEFQISHPRSSKVIPLLLRFFQPLVFDCYRFMYFFKHIFFFILFYFFISLKEKRGTKESGWICESERFRELGLLLCLVILPRKGTVAAWWCFPPVFH